MDITSQTNKSDMTQYTNDTLIPISKKFLTKTLIKNEAIKKANKELLDLYNIAINKKPEIVEIEKVKYIKKEPTLSEKYNIYEKINAEINAKAEKTKKKEERLDFVKYKELQNNEIYKEYKKDYDLLNKIYFSNIRKKKKILRHYAKAIDMNKNKDDDNLKIQIYDIIIGKNN
jgi:hypothetical protein